MATLVKEGARVLWLRDRASELLGVMRSIEAHAPTRGPEYIFVDDLYDPQGRARLDLDELVSLATYRPDVNWPLVVTCGPPEFRQDLEDDAGGRGLRIHDWRIPPVDQTESETLRHWFVDRTGRSVSPGPAFEQGEGLMVSMMFELRHDDLEQLAHRFRERLEQRELKDALYQPLALDRLYVLTPAGWLTDGQRAQLEAINQDDDFSFISTASGSGYLKLTHPHLSDAIYRVVRRPAVEIGYTDDVVAAFDRALQTDPATALRLLRVFASGHERLEISQPDDWDATVGTSGEMEILKIEPKSLSIMVSRRAVLERERRAIGNDQITSPEVGQIIDGRIDNIVDYGLFVDVGGTDGLLHRSKLLDPSEGDLRLRFDIGGQIRVEVTDIERERGRIGLAEGEPGDLPQP